MLFNFLLVVCFANINALDCDFTLSGGESFDLSNIGSERISLDGCGEMDRFLVFNPCKDLSPQNCISTYTTGPGPACDTSSSNSFWVGGIASATTSKYSNNTFYITYPGKLQTSEIPNQIRSLYVKYECDTGAAQSSTRCISIEKQTGLTMYNIVLISKDACPISDGLEMPLWVYIVIGAVVLSPVLIVGVFVLIIFSPCITVCIVLLKLFIIFLAVLLLCIKLGIIITAASTIFSFGLLIIFLPFLPFLLLLSTMVVCFVCFICRPRSGGRRGNYGRIEGGYGNQQLNHWN